MESWCTMRHYERWYNQLAKLGQEVGYASTSYQGLHQSLSTDKPFYRRGRSKCCDSRNVLLFYETTAALDQKCRSYVSETM
jgi:hypothetical protein